MGRAILIAVSVLLGLAAASAPALASREIYQYRVVHERYGDIGTYTNVIDRQGDDVTVDSELKIAVRVVGITVFRQEAHRIEHWNKDRLVGFHGVTVTNGDRLEISGEARPGGFAVTTPAGTVVAPANVHTSNPWSAMVLKTDTMMVTSSGKVEHVRVSGGQETSVSLAGATLRLHQYTVDGEKRRFVWLDDRGEPIAFRTDENGARVDFVMTRQQAQAH